MMDKELRPLVENLLKEDVYDDADKALITWVFISLRTADALGYKKDSFIRLPKDEQHDALLAVMDEDQLLPSDPSPSEQCWRAGYFYNNALLRIAALGEKGLRDLFKRHGGKIRNKNFSELLRWYEEKFGKSLERVNQVRKYVNEFKHEPHYTQTRLDIEHFKEGEEAFKEVLSLLLLMVATKSNPSIDAEKSFCGTP